MRFACLKTTANNVGEEIQILAAQRFLPKIDLYMNKERLNKYKLDKPHKVIINGWYGRNPRRFYTEKNIKPFITSLHITPSIVKEFFNKEVVKFLHENSPIGCRDQYTLELMQKNNIPAYFSGCLTMTLVKNEIGRAHV